jgi:hypothetical protein
MDRYDHALPERLRAAADAMDQGLAESAWLYGWLYE